MLVVGGLNRFDVFMFYNPWYSTSKYYNVLQINISVPSKFCF